LRGYLFTDRERLRAWFESGVEDDGTRMLFVAVRRSLDRIAGDMDLLADMLKGHFGGCEGRGYRVLPARRG
jgi:hypothetical protein